MSTKEIWLRTWHVVLICAALLVMLGLHRASTSAGVPRQGGITPKTRPDIITIMSDDLDLESLDAALANNFMPNLQAYLINGGTTFQNSFVSNSLCCPSRATFLTGQYPHNTGVQTNGQYHGGCIALRDDSTLPVWLHSVGYKTGLIGKYLNLYGSGGPESTRTCLNEYYIPPGWDDWQALIEPWTYDLYAYQINDNRKIIGSEITPAEYQTDVLARRAARFIQESATNATRPMFLLLAPPIPHLSAVAQAGCSTNWGAMFTILPARRDIGTAASIPLTRGNSYNELDMSDKPSFYQHLTRLTPAQDACMQSIFRDRLQALRALDKLIGTVVQTLINVQRFDRTVLIFTSDNGFLLGQHRLMHKGWPYEESIRVPLYIRAPGIPVQSTSLFALNNDLTPTILDFAEAIPTISVDGSSLREVLKNPTTTNWRKRIFAEWFNYGGGNAPQTVDPFTDFLVSSQTLDNWYPPTYGAVRTSLADATVPNMTYVEYSDGSREFYDLNQDPDQLVSAANSPTATQATQMTILSRWIAALSNCGGGKCQILERASAPQ
jgi:N-acetylglucosamine-6-sulfatase